MRKHADILGHRLLGLRVVGRDLGLDGGLNVWAAQGDAASAFRELQGVGVAGSRASRVSRRRDETTGERAASSRKHEGQWPLTELPVVPLEAAAEAPRPLVLGGERGARATGAVAVLRGRTCKGADPGKRANAFLPVWISISTVLDHRSKTVEPDGSKSVSDSS